MTDEGIPTAERSVHGLHGMACKDVGCWSSQIGEDAEVKRVLVAMVLLGVSACLPASAGDTTTYVGGGRYLCHDKTPECAAVKQNNRHIIQGEIDARQREPYRSPDPTFSGPTGYSDLPLTQHERQRHQDHQRREKR